MSKKIQFYGYSDDVFSYRILDSDSKVVEEDEIDCWNSTATLRVSDGDLDPFLVLGHYCLGNQSQEWMVGISLTEKTEDFPSHVNVHYYREHDYSVGLELSGFSDNVEVKIMSHPDES